MKRSLSLVIAFGAIIILGTACAMPPSSMLGGISVDVTEMRDLGNGKIGSKTGRACTNSILGWVTSGDSGLKAAAADGNISQINSVDYYSKHVLGIVGEHCTIVYGN